MMIPPNTRPSQMMGAIQKSATQEQYKIQSLAAQDQVSFTHRQNKSPEKLMEDLQTTVEQAKKKAAPEERILEAHHAVENLKTQIQKMQSLPVQVRQQKIAELNKKLKEQEALHHSLLQMKKTKGQEQLHLKRPMAQVENELLDRMMADLGSSNLGIVESAKESLLLLGIKEPVIKEMENLLHLPATTKQSAPMQQTTSSSKTHQVTFGMMRHKEEGGISHNWLDTGEMHRDLYGTDNWRSIPTEVRTKMLQDQIKETAVNNNSMTDVIDAGMNHELNTTVSTGHRVLFGNDYRPVINSGGHVVEIKNTEPLPSGCTELNS